LKAKVEKETQQLALKHAKIQSMKNQMAKSAMVKASAKSALDNVKHDAGDIAEKLREARKKEAKSQAAANILTKVSLMARKGVANAEKEGGLNDEQKHQLEAMTRREAKLDKEELDKGSKAEVSDHERDDGTDADGAFQDDPFKTSEKVTSALRAGREGMAQLRKAENLKAKEQRRLIRKALHKMREAQRKMGQVHATGSDAKRVEGMERTLDAAQRSGEERLQGNRDRQEKDDRLEMDKALDSWKLQKAENAMLKRKKEEEAAKDASSKAEKNSGRRRTGCHWKVAGCPDQS
jgi:hypothetical protein